MAWTYTQSFDSLNDGALGGQDSWGTSGTGASVQSTVKLGSSGKSVEFKTSGTFFYRSITGVTDGTFYFALRIDTEGTAGDAAVLQMRDGAGSNRACTVAIRDDGGTYKLNFNGATSSFVTASIDLEDWYIIEYDFDCSTDDAVIKYKKSGGSWSSGTTLDFHSASTSLARIYLGADAHTGSVGYLDEISDEDPDSGSPSSQAHIIH